MKSVAVGMMVMLGSLLVGCGHSQPYRTHERLERGLVIVLPGIEGRSPFNEAICKGLDQGGVDWAIELYDWTSSLGPLYNLKAYDRNRRKASAIGWRINRYLWEYPSRPVVLVGQSGGGAMAVWVAEELPPGQKIDKIILLSAALSPDYILDFALNNTDRGIVSFHSSLDWVFLGVGTTVYGTMDGQHRASAGRAGFELPKLPQSVEAYKKLVQIAWRPEMAKAGNPGLHLTGSAARFIAEYVAPLVANANADARKP